MHMPNEEKSEFAELKKIRPFLTYALTEVEQAGKVQETCESVDIFENDL